MRLMPLSLILIAGFVLGGTVFKTTAPRHCGTILPNDHVFVLTGDGRRIPFAVKLIERHPRTRLHIIGVGSHNINITPEYLRKRIDFEDKSKNTAENAIAIHEIARQYALHRLILVTTEDHMHRAMFLVNQQLPDIEVTACPVPLRGMAPTKRLERWGGEYLKYIGTIFGFRTRA